MILLATMIMIFQIQNIWKGVTSSGSIDREYLDREKNDFAHWYSRPKLLDDENDKISSIPTEEDLIRKKLVKTLDAFYDRNNFISFKGSGYLFLSCHVRVSEWIHAQ